jgi:hypothetical protein
MPCSYTRNFREALLYVVHAELSNRIAKSNWSIGFIWQAHRTRVTGAIGMPLLGSAPLLSFTICIQ